MYNGVINIYKEPGFTSHDVVAKLRGITHQKKIGHTGTLDPAAEGVLCVCLGAATRICDMLTDATKEYEAVLLLGITTDTQDTTGEVLSQSEVNVSEELVRETIMSFVGDIEQIPPMYSALKVDGKKLYELAREGKEIERKPRKITIFDIKISEISLPRITMRVSCSKGTYIRTLCNDIGEKLGCGGAMEHLTRTRVGEFTVENSLTLSEVSEYEKEDRISEILTSPSDIFADLPIALPNFRGEKMAINGNVLVPGDLKFTDCKEPVPERIRVVSDTGFFYGVYEYNRHSNTYKPQKMFLC